MHRLNSFTITTLDKQGSGMPGVEINNRELHLVSYQKSQFTANGTHEMIESYEVAGYLAPATHKDDAVGYDTGDGATDMKNTIRVFIFNTFTNEGWETTNKGGMKEAALLRWSQSENHAEELLQCIATETCGIMTER